MLSLADLKKQGFLAAAEQRQLEQAYDFLLRVTITNLVLKTGMDSVEAVSAITANIKTDYVKVKISRPSEIESLRRAGYRVAHPDWGAFMVKPLIPGITANDAVRIFGIGTDRFLISWLDTT